MATSRTDPRVSTVLGKLFHGTALPGGLRPFIERKLRSALGKDWLTNAGLSERQLEDPAELLWVIFRFWGQAFKDPASDQRIRAWALELREDRNSWAHNDPISEKDARRVLDTAERLLRRVGASAKANEIAAICKEHLTTQQAAHKVQAAMIASSQGAKATPHSTDTMPKSVPALQAGGPIVLVLSIKGGVAKTALTLGLSEAIASRGHRVLAIDADHQCALSVLLLGEERAASADKKKRTLHDLLSAMLADDFDVETLPRFIAGSGSNIANLDGRLAVLPCSFRINDFQTNRAKARKVFKTTDQFDQLLDRNRSAFMRWLCAKYDFVLVDCPPSLAVHVRFLLRCATGYIIPSVPDRISVRGAAWLHQRIVKTAERKALGLVWTLHRAQNERHSTMMRTVQKWRGRGDSKLGGLPPAFKTVIPNAAAIVRALDDEKPVASLRAKYTSEFADIFLRLADEVIKATRRSSAGQ